MYDYGFICGVHYCYAVDDTGIESTFLKIKTKLSEKGAHHVTLLYVSTSNQFIFKKKFDLLEKQFALQFIVFYENTIENNLIQVAIDKILAINVMTEMIFFISGNKFFSTTIANQLMFSGVRQIEIQESVIM